MLGMKTFELNSQNKIVIGVAGLPGTGKSTVVKIAMMLGYPAIVMGDFVREEAFKKGLKPTAEKLGKLMFQMRKEMGENIVAKLTVEAVEKLEDPVIFIDGIRSLEEVRTFKKNFKNFRLIAVYSPDEFRFKRIFGRHRVDDTTVWNEFRERDKREFELGVRGVMAIADVTLHNTGSLEEFKVKVKKVLESVISEVSSEGKG